MKSKLRYIRLVSAISLWFLVLIFTMSRIGVPAWKLTRAFWMIGVGFILIVIYSLLEKRFKARRENKMLERITEVKGNNV